MPRILSISCLGLLGLTVLWSSHAVYAVDEAKFDYLGLARLELKHGAMPPAEHDDEKIRQRLSDLEKKFEIVNSGTSLENRLGAIQKASDALTERLTGRKQTPRNKAPEAPKPYQFDPLDVARLELQHGIQPPSEGKADANLSQRLSEIEKKLGISNGSESHGRRVELLREATAELAEQLKGIKRAKGDKFPYLELARMELKYSIQTPTAENATSQVPERLTALEKRLHMKKSGEDVQKRFAEIQRVSDGIIEDWRNFPAPKGFESLEWFDFLARFNQVERELDLVAKGLFTERLKAIEAKLGIQADPSETFVSRATSVLKRHQQGANGRGASRGAELPPHR